MFHARGNPVCRKEDCSPYDIGTVYKDIVRFSNEEKFRFIQNDCYLAVRVSRLRTGTYRGLLSAI